MKLKNLLNILKKKNLPKKKNFLIKKKNKKKEFPNKKKEFPMKKKNFLIKKKNLLTVFQKKRKEKENNFLLSQISRHFIGVHVGLPQDPQICKEYI